MLDNLEHVIGTALDLAALLRDCHRVKFLVTSRVPLRLSAEREFVVPPLSSGPIADGISSADDEIDGVSLFVRRAQAVRPDFDLGARGTSIVSEICRRLDGLPLAIELAAARSKVLTPDAILLRLDQRLNLLRGGPLDQPLRHQTMRATVAWSHDLLTPDEQAAFRRLAIFDGGWTLDAAETVLDNGNPALDIIEALVEKSLIQVTDLTDSESRFSMLETVRAFGLERLALAGESQRLGRLHADWVLALTDDGWHHLTERRDAVRWLDRIDAEFANLRAAFAWLDAAGDGAGLLALAGAVGPFCTFRGHLREGRSWLKRAFAAASAVDRHDRGRMLSLISAGALAHYAGDDGEARPHLLEAAEVARTVGHPWSIGHAAMLLGIIAEDAGRYAEARPWLTEARDVFRASDIRVNVALTTFHLGVVALGEGKTDEATEHLHLASVSQRHLNDRWGLALSLGFLGLLATERGDVLAALTLLRESLELRRSIGAFDDLAGALADVATLAAKTGDIRTASRLFGAAQTHRATMGSPAKLPERLAYERAMTSARAALGDSEFEAEYAAGFDLALDGALDLAMAFAPPEAPDPVQDLIGRLTERERDVLTAMMSGVVTNRAIAALLSISPKTAGNHVDRIIAKLGVNTRTAAVTVTSRIRTTSTVPKTNERAPMARSGDSSP